MIGCWSLLSKGKITDVVYFYDLTEERKREAEATGQKFGFKVWFNNPEAFGEWNVDIAPEDTIFVPTVKDAHPDHRNINIKGRYLARAFKCQLYFYSIDMNTVWRRTLKPEESAAKREALLEAYPSQRALFADEKYFLFEGITNNETLYEYTFTTTTGAVVTVKTYSKNFGPINKGDEDSLADAVLSYGNSKYDESVSFYKDGITETWGG